MVMISVARAVKNPLEVLIWKEAQDVGRKKVRWDGNGKENV